MTLGVDLSTERQLLFLRALAKWSADDIEFACMRAAEETRFPRMPIPGELIDYARQAPRRQLRGDMNRPVLDHTTSYNEKLAAESIAAVMSLFDDGFDCKSIPPLCQPTAAEQKKAFGDSYAAFNTGEQRRA